MQMPVRTVDATAAGISPSPTIAPAVTNASADQRQHRGVLGTRLTAFGLPHTHLEAGRGKVRPPGCQTSEVKAEAASRAMSNSGSG